MYVHFVKDYLATATVSHLVMTLSVFLLFGWDICSSFFFSVYEHAVCVKSMIYIIQEFTYLSLVVKFK